MAEKQSVTFHWGQSRPAILGYLESVRRTNALNSDLSSQISNAKRYIVDLGHASRGLDRFPMELTVPTESDPNQNPFILSPTVLLRVIAEEADRYMQTHPWRISGQFADPTSCQSDIDAIATIASYLEGQLQQSLL